MSERKAVGTKETDKLPAPSERAVANIQAAGETLAARPRRKVAATGVRVEKTGDGPVKIGPRHSDVVGWAQVMAATLGIDDPYLASNQVGDMISAAGLGNADDADALEGGANLALAWVADAEPQSAIETALLMQMYGAHKLTCTMAVRAQKAGMRDAMNDYTRMFNQTARTFAAQAEALAKLRSGGKQQVEVRYVYVDARSQTYVAGGERAGVPPLFGEQPHAPGGTVDYAPAPGLPMWGQDAGGDAMPIASDQGQAALPDARGTQPRRPQGRGQRKLSVGHLDGRDNRREAVG